MALLPNFSPARKMKRIRNYLSSERRPVTSIVCRSNWQPRLFSGYVPTFLARNWLFSSTLTTHAAIIAAVSAPKGRAPLIAKCESVSSAHLVLIDGHRCMVKFRDVFFFYFLPSNERREHHECLFELIATDTDINQFKESICKKQSKTLRKALRVFTRGLRRGKFFLIFRLFCSWIFNRLCLFYLTAPIKSIEILMSERIRSASKTIRVCRCRKGRNFPSMMLLGIFSIFNCWRCSLRKRWQIFASEQKA